MTELTERERMTQVTDADRQAARYAFVRWHCPDTLAEAFAQAREQAVQEAVAERDARIEALEAENVRLREAAVMAVADMSRARGRLEIIAMCNEDRRIAAALGGTCDFVRSAALQEIDNG